MVFKRVWASLSLPIVLSLLSTATWAEPTAADKATARSLMRQGDQKFQIRNYQGALRDYEAAHAIMGVPTTGLAVAKARIELDKLIEAQELLLEIVRSPQDPQEPPPFIEARKEATALSENLVARIPSIVIQIQGPEHTSDIELTIDGQSVPVVGNQTPRKINPGPHVITAKAKGFTDATSKVNVQERETKQVAMTLVPGESHSKPEDKGKSSVETFAVYREGPHVGFGGGPAMILPFNGGTLIGGTAHLLLNIGITPQIDLRTGVFFGFVGSGDGALMTVGGPLTVRFNVSSRFAIGGGLTAGYGTNFNGASGFVGGPEWTPLSLRLGDRREFELDFTQGLHFGDVPSDYHHALTLTYLLLDD